MPKLPEDFVADRASVFAKLMNLRAAVDDAIAEAKTLWWQPREYVSAPSSLWGRRDDDQLSPKVDPGEVGHFVFGVNIVRPGSEFPGLPEMTRYDYGIERVFEIQQLAVDDDIAEYFTIRNLTVGVVVLWSHSQEVQAVKFAASAKSPVKIGRYTCAGLPVSVEARNTSDKPQIFRAKLIGREQIE